MRAGRRRCRPDLFPCRLGTAAADVLLDRVAEQEGLLQNDRDLPAVGLQLEPADIEAIDQDSSGLGIVESKQQRKYRGLSGPRWPDEPHSLSRSNPEGKFLQDRTTLLIAERHPLEGDLSRHRRGRDGVGCFAHLFAGVEDFQDALAAHRRLVRFRADSHQIAAGLVKSPEVGQEDHQLPG